MNTLPILDSLYACSSDAQRADWLLRCPWQLIGNAQLDIRAEFKATNFSVGIAYLEAVIAGLASVRNQDGSLPFHIAFSLKLARIDLMIAARTGGAT